MSMLEQIPAVRRLDVEPAHLQAFDIVGPVSSADVENLFGLLEAAYALHPRVDILLRLVDLDDVAWDEVAKDTMSEGKEDARAHVSRCAIIGTRTALAAAQGFFLEVEPVEFREFLTEDEQAAWNWLGGKLRTEEV
jgi:hypothetical protein